jgi:flagellar biosynthetic protein FliR
VLDPSTAPGLLEVFNQIMIGSVMGLILQVVVAAMVVGGQSIAAAMGLSMANMLDPNMGSVPVISQLMIIMSTLIFVGFGGHAIMLGLISESFHSLPIGTSILNQNVYGRVLQWSSMVFLGAVLMALPVMVSLLFINIGLGVVTRAAPSLNIFAVGFPAMIIAGFLILIISMESIGARIEWLWVQGFAVVREVLGVSNV